MSACKKHGYAGMKICPECIEEIDLSEEGRMTTNYTDHDYRMMALAAGYEIEVHETVLGGVHYVEREIDRASEMWADWNPLESDADNFRLTVALIEKYTFNDCFGFFVQRTDKGFEIESEILIPGLPHASQINVVGETLNESWVKMAVAIGKSL